MTDINWGLGVFTTFSSPEFFLYQRILNAEVQKICPCDLLELAKPTLHIDAYDVVFKVDLKTDNNCLNINLLSELLQCYYDEFDYIKSVNPDEIVYEDADNLVNISEATTFLPYIPFVLLDNLGNLIVCLSFGLKFKRYYTEFVRVMEINRVMFDRVNYGANLHLLGHNAHMLYPYTEHDFSLRFSIYSQSYCLYYKHNSIDLTDYKLKTLRNNTVAINTVKQYLTRKRSVLYKTSPINTHKYYFGCFIPLNKDHLDNLIELIQHKVINVIGIYLHDHSKKPHLLLEQVNINEEMSDNTLLYCLNFGYHDDMIIHKFITKHCIDPLEKGILNELHMGHPIKKYNGMSKSNIINDIKCYMQVNT
jgi:hypothetical protein